MSSFLSKSIYQMHKKFLTGLVMMLVLTPGFSQSARQTGLRSKTPQVFALTNATIVTEPGRSLPGATLVIRDGIIEAVGVRIGLPADAQVIDMTGKIIYPGFIDMYSAYGLTDPTENESISRAHDNIQMRSFFRAADAFRHNEKDASQLRSQGFVMAHVVPQHGLIRGKGTIISLGNGPISALIVRQEVSQVLSIDRSYRLGRGYPLSAMGAYSFIRQSFYDAQWYEQAHAVYSASPRNTPRPENNPALAVLGLDMKNNTPFVFETRNEQWLFRAADLAGEFGLTLWIRGSGYEYLRAKDIAGLNMPVILPLNFPKAPSVSTPEEALQVSLESLRHWHLAPENPGRLVQAGVQICFSAQAQTSDFLKNLQTAVERGLPARDALAALTTIPARLLGLSNRYGSLEPGKSASFVVSEKDLFAPGSTIDQVWIEGQQFRISSPRTDFAGKWNIQGIHGLEGSELILEGSAPRFRGSLSNGGKTIRLRQLRADNHRIHFAFEGDSLGLSHSMRLSAQISGNELWGFGETSTGTYFEWSALRIQQISAQQAGSRGAVVQPDIPWRYPSMEFGPASEPEQPRHLMIRNATIWTQTGAGILEGADMLVERGKIAAVGHNLNAPRGAQIIDARGMHLTPGLIDPHLHTSVLGEVNETGDAITSETRILDVIDANNIWIYRLLAGGLTTAKLFHGSANPIGGQDAVIKLRWGATADRLIMPEAKPGLKLALGENVKRGSGNRYPGSRMGTEQIIRDAFQAAIEYSWQWDQWRKNPIGLPPRKDLQLEPILEVIKGERMAHVHAYRQDEMLMTLRLAEDFGFRVATFEHALEGYKIADELRLHGAAAVVWTDWSSFKIEAQDGILQNARLLLDAGVLTSLHSDNTQLSTRMNWEAAKTMKTGVSETDAMNLITLYPAKIMGIDHVTGSLEPGKDADFVLWNGHPLSSFSTAEQTWIEGRRYFDRKQDQMQRDAVIQERNTLIQHVLKQQRDSNTENSR